jgi:hypothetical protein
MQDTPPNWAPEGLGTDWIVQLAPSHRSANGRSVFVLSS